MKNISLDVKTLLDKLYNLKSEDSVILTKIDSEKKLAEDTKTRTKLEKDALESKIQKLTAEEKLLAEEGASLIAVLKNINRADFDVVLEKLNIDFNPDEVKNRVETHLPEVIDLVKRDNLSSMENLSSIEKEMHDAITMIDELAIRKDEALSNQNKLNEYFNLSLNGNINITRDELTSLLAKFELTDEEQREAAKILMFPEDGLFNYEENIKEVKKSGKSFSDVFAEAKNNIIEEDLTEKIATIEETKAPIVEEEKVEVEEIDVKALLKELGFDYLDFTASDLEYIEKNLNKAKFEDNIKLITELEINKDIFIENVELFNDSELKDKINILLEIGKVPFDIYLNPNVMVKYNLEELINSINTLKESGLDPKKVPLMAF